MSYSQELSDWTVPAVDSAEQVAGFALRLTSRPKYGFPCRSSVKATKGVDVSCPTPASKACWGAQVCPPSSGSDTRTEWNDWAIGTVHPGAAWVRSAAFHATVSAPARGV